MHSVTFMFIGCGVSIFIANVDINTDIRILCYVSLAAEN